MARITPILQSSTPDKNPESLIGTVSGERVFGLDASAIQIDLALDHMRDAGDPRGKYMSISKGDGPVAGAPGVRSEYPGQVQMGEAVVEAASAEAESSGDEPLSGVSGVLDREAISARAKRLAETGPQIGADGRYAGPTGRLMDHMDRHAELSSGKPPSLESKYGSHMRITRPGIVNEINPGNDVVELSITELTKSSSGGVSPEARRVIEARKAVDNAPSSNIGAHL